MRAQNGSNSFKELKHLLGVDHANQVPKVIEVFVKAIDGNNNGFIFKAMGAAMGDDSRHYGGLIFAYDETNVRLWAPTKNDDLNHGSIINIFDGWGGEVNTQQSNVAEVRIVANGNCSISWDFESEWFNMSSQADNKSFKEIAHGIGEVPSEVRVLTRALDGSNKGFIFEAVGMAQSDDDIGNSYGGLIYGYDKYHVRLWAPSTNSQEVTSDSNGAIINVRDGWGGEIHAQSSNHAQVMVTARANIPCGSDGSADFNSGWFSLSSQAGTASYVELFHKLEAIPDYVRVLMRANDGVNAGFVFEGMGNAQTDDLSGAYGGVVFGYDRTRVRIWAPDRNDDKYTNGHIISIVDGWGGEVSVQQSQTASIKVLAWQNCNLCRS